MKKKKCLLFVDDITLQTEIHKKTKKMLELINKFSKITGH